MFVIQPTLTEEENKTQIQKIMDIIINQGSEIVATKDMGIRRLAYEVKKHKRGHYVVVLFKSNGKSIFEIERNLRINENIIKFLTIKYTNKVEIAQFNKMAIEFTPKEKRLKEDSKESVKENSETQEA
jgi:small subunit ribosomal protein S6